MKRILFLLVGLLVWASPLPLFSAITVGTGAGTAAVTTNTLTISITVSGSNTFLQCGTSTDDVAPADVSSVTFNGDNLTFIQRNSFAVFNKQELWYMVAPDDGTHDAVVTWAASQGQVGFGCIPMAGVNQATPIGTPVKADGSSQLATVDASSASGEVVVDHVAVYAAAQFGADLTAGAGQTEKYDAVEATLAARYGGSTEAGGATVTMSWTWDANNRTWGISAVPVKPATASTMASLCLLLGVCP